MVFLLIGFIGYSIWKYIKEWIIFMIGIIIVYNFNLVSVVRVDRINYRLIEGF